VQLKGEDSSFYSNGIKSVDKKMSVSDITATNISLSILPTRWRQKPADIDMERNYVNVTLANVQCVGAYCNGVSVCCTINIKI